MKLIIKYIRPYLGRMSLGLVIKFFGTIMDLFLPYILAHIIDNVIPKNSMPPVLLWGLLMVGCAVIAWVFNILANRMAAAVARD
jgi:ATP-binding cassette subfamily B protein